MESQLLTRLWRVTSMAFDATREIDERTLQDSEHFPGVFTNLALTTLHIHSPSGFSERFRSSLSRLKAIRTLAACSLLSAVPFP